MTRNAIEATASAGRESFRPVRRAFRLAIHMNSHADGRKTRAENFDKTASPNAIPKIKFHFHPGLSIQIRDTNIANAVVEAKAMSVVTSPACARIGGSEVNNSVANTAAKGPAARRVHRYTPRDA